MTTQQFESVSGAIAAQKRQVSLTTQTITAQTVAEQSFTVAGLAVGDVVTVNPTSALPTGLAIAYCRVSAVNTLKIAIQNVHTSDVATGALTFNVESNRLTNTDSPVGAKIGVKGTITIPGVTVTAHSTATTSVTLAGAKVGDVIRLGTSQALAWAYVSAANTVTVAFANPQASGSTVIGDLLYSYELIVQGNNTDNLEATSGPETVVKRRVVVADGPYAIGAQSYGTLFLTVPGILANEVVNLSPRNSYQLGFGGARREDTNLVRVQVQNSTGGSISIANGDVFDVTVQKT